MFPSREGTHALLPPQAPPRTSVLESVPAPLLTPREQKHRGEPGEQASEDKDTGLAAQVPSSSLTCTPVGFRPVIGTVPENLRTRVRDVQPHRRPWTATRPACGGERH